MLCTLDTCFHRQKKWKKFQCFENELLCLFFFSGRPPTHQKNEIFVNKQQTENEIFWNVLFNFINSKRCIKIRNESNSIFSIHGPALGFVFNLRLHRINQSFDYISPLHYTYHHCVIHIIMRYRYHYCVIHIIIALHHHGVIHIIIALYKS